MTGIRSSFVFCKEETYKGGIPDEKKWISPPAGSFLSTTHNRSTQKVFSTGTKTYDTLAYGQLSGSWEWTFTLDYDYIEPLFLIFEDVKCTIDDEKKVATYTFSKANNMRVPSFTIRRKILNNITNGTEDVLDETIIYKGCVVKTARFSKAAGASQVGVSLSGFYATEETTLGDLATTDYQEYTGELVEFSCMFAGPIDGDNYVANTESLSLGIENSASAIFSTCTPFASDFAEAQTSYTFGTTAYSNDPLRYKMRMYGGGLRAGTSGTVRPKAKGMRPIPEVHLASYTGELDDMEFGAGSENPIKTVFDESAYNLDIKLEDLAIKSLTYQKGDGSKLQDQINSTEFRKMSITIKSPNMAGIDNIWTETNDHSLA